MYTVHIVYIVHHKYNLNIYIQDLTLKPPYSLIYIITTLTYIYNLPPQLYSSINPNLQLKFTIQFLQSIDCIYIYFQQHFKMINIIYNFIYIATL